MKKFILVAAAVLSMGAGSDFAYHAGQVMRGPAYSSTVTGTGG